MDARRRGSTVAVAVVVGAVLGFAYGTFVSSETNCSALSVTGPPASCYQVLGWSVSQHFYYRLLGTLAGVAIGVVIGVAIIVLANSKQRRRLSEPRSGQ